MDLHHTPVSRSALFSEQARSPRPVDIPNWSAWGDLHSQGCSILSRTGLLFPINHTPVGDPGLAPGRLGDFKSPGSALPAEASRREMVGMKGLAPPRLPDSESGPSAVRVKPHAREIGTPGRTLTLISDVSKRRALVIELRERWNWLVRRSWQRRLMSCHGFAPCSMLLSLCQYSTSKPDDALARVTSIGQSRFFI